MGRMSCDAAHLTRTLALAASLLPLLAFPARAYRPFDGTDAGVAATRRFEVEFGPLGYLRVGNDRFLIGPALRSPSGPDPATTSASKHGGSSS
jgi:hypothetical protein